MSISEIFVIILVALLVIKPEQMPELAYTLGRFAKYMRKMGMTVKSNLKTIMSDLDQSDEYRSSK